jgi:hypothetical protein
MAMLKESRPRAERHVDLSGIRRANDDGSPLTSVGTSESKSFPGRFEARRDRGGCFRTMPRIL